MRRFEGKFSICRGKQELARTCKGETLSVLKLAVHSVNFGLCNYLDNFACPLLIGKKYILTFKEESSSVINSVILVFFSIVHGKASFQIKSIT